MKKNKSYYIKKGFECRRDKLHGYGKYYNGNLYGVEIANPTNPMSGFKTRDFYNIYRNYAYDKNNDYQFIVVGEDVDKYYSLVFDGISLISTPKTSFKPTKIQQFEISGSYSDHTVYLKDIGNNKYKVCLELGDYTKDVTQKLYEFDMEFDNSWKCLGLMNRDNNYQFRWLEVLQSSVKESDIGMKIDTALDREPIYFCDGTKDRLILTEDMIVRGNTNFDNDEITINDKRIITEDNLKG